MATWIKSLFTTAQTDSGDDAAWRAVAAPSPAAFVIMYDGPLDFGGPSQLHRLTLDVADIVVSFIGAEDSGSFGQLSSLLALASCNRAWRFACASNDEVWAVQPGSALRSAAPLSVPLLKAALDAHRTATGAFSTRRNWIADAPRCDFATNNPLPASGAPLPWRFGIYPGIPTEPRPWSWLPSSLSGSVRHKPLNVALFGLPDAATLQVLDLELLSGRRDPRQPSTVTRLIPTIGIHLHQCGYPPSGARFSSLTTQPCDERPMLTVIDNMGKLLRDADAIVYVVNPRRLRASDAEEEHIHRVSAELSVITGYQDGRAVPLLVLLSGPAASDADSVVMMKALRAEQMANVKRFSQAADNGCRSWRVQECTAAASPSCPGLRKGMGWLAYTMEEQARTDSAERRKRMWRRGFAPVSSLQVYGTPTETAAACSEF